MPDHEIIDENKPWLVIPYFAGDKGRKGIERDPLPSNATWYLCTGMRVNGGPLREYTPGEPFDVEVDVRNYGGGAAETLAYVTIWWSDPTSGFGSAVWFGADSVVVGSKTGAATVTINGVIPESDDPLHPRKHVCLLASVEAAFNDNLPAVIAPGSDRHWAQLNLDRAKTNGAAVQHLFLVGNPQHEPVRMCLRARLITEDRIGAVAQALHVQPFQPEHAELRLSGGEGDLPVARGDEGAVSIDLPPGGSVAVELRGEINPPPEPETAAIIEILQYAPQNPDAVIGALGIVITSDA